ncbi:MAG: pimeloyl-ACP methyl ester carboxylesterase [Gammaproteobacteria bacterium]|jgi:pimeloyl-ACP methyl ester carboxylesterase
MELSVNGQSTYIYTGARAFNAALPSVMFVHGAGLDHTVWILQSRWFAHHGYNALAVDLPGHGRSQGEALDSIEKMGAWIWQCLDALNVANAHLIGHSMGSLAALDAAANAPERALFTALLGIAVPMPVSDALLDAARDDLAAAINMITLWGHSFSAQLGGNQAPGMWMMGSASHLLARSYSGVLYKDLLACSAYHAGLQHAQLITNPVLVVLGKQDIMASPRGAKPLLQALVNSSSVVLDRCGHMMMAEQPDRVLNALAKGIAMAPCTADAT